MPIMRKPELKKAMEALGWKARCFDGDRTFHFLLDDRRIETRFLIKELMTEWLAEANMWCSFPEFDKAYEKVSANGGLAVPFKVYPPIAPTT